jgi:hypothetical protein
VSSFWPWCCANVTSACYSFLPIGEAWQALKKHKFYKEFLLVQVANAAPTVMAADFKIQYAKTLVTMLNLALIGKVSRHCLALVIMFIFWDVHVHDRVRVHDCVRVHVCVSDRVIFYYPSLTGTEAKKNIKWIYKQIASLRQMSIVVLYLILSTSMLGHSYSSFLSSLLNKFEVL